MRLLLGLFFLVASVVYSFNDSLYVEVTDSSVRIWNYVNLNCCSQILMKADVNDDQIILKEIDTSKSWCKCTCDFILCSEVKGLKPGSYTLDVFRNNPISFPADSFFYISSFTLFVGSTHFPDNGYISSSSYQSRCQKQDSNAFIVYSNSFESSADTIGWLGSMQFREEAAPDGGRSSALISGGCIWPHFWIDFPPAAENRYYLIRCWGKSLEQGGIIGIRTATDEINEALITVNDTIWTYYESLDTLFCPAGTKITLFMGSGGIIPGSMLIDNVEIIKLTTSNPTEISEPSLKELAFELFQNYPNPFNPVTKIRYTIPSGPGSQNDVSLKLYDVLGNEIAVLVNETQPSGTYEVEFDGTSLSSGIYFYTLNINGMWYQKKMCLIK